MSSSTRTKKTPSPSSTKAEPANASAETPTLTVVDPFERRPEPSTPAAESSVIETSVIETLPTMSDLDRLAGDLDRVDLTLAQLDDPTRSVDS